MISDDEHDRDDALFRRALDRAAGPAPDVAAGWAALAARAPGARRTDRRVPRLVVLATSAATLALVLSLARPGPDRDPVATGAGTVPAASVPVTGSSAAAPSTAATPDVDSTATGGAGTPAPTAPAGTPASAPPDAAADDGAGTTGVPAATAPGSSAASTSTGGATGGTAGTRPTATGPATTASGGPGPSPSVPTSVTPPARRTATLAGGTISAVIDGDRLVDPVVTPADGWTAEVLERRDDRIEVRFRSADRTITVRVRADGDALRVDDRS